MIRIVGVIASSGRRQDTLQGRVYDGVHRVGAFDSGVSRFNAMVHARYQ